MIQDPSALQNAEASVEIDGPGDPSIYFPSREIIEVAWSIETMHYGPGQSKSAFRECAFGPFVLPNCVFF